MKTNQQITIMYDYMPFGEQILVSLSDTKDCLTYIADDCLVAENGFGKILGDF